MDSSLQRLLKMKFIFRINANTSIEKQPNQD